MKRLLFFIILIFYSEFAVAQNTDWIILGKVIDENKKPVEFANVYANNTTLGTTTNEKGEFSLKIPKRIPNIDLVISSVGYLSQKTNIASDYQKELTFQLKSLILKELKVTAKRDRGFKQKFEIFKRALLGVSDFTRDCEILNSEVINLDYDEDQNVVASAEKPFYVVNNALGYKITVNLNFLTTNGLTTSQITNIFFESLKSTGANQESKWKQNREQAYKNSLKNFLVSLVDSTNLLKNFAFFKSTKVLKGYIKITTVANEIKYGNLTACDLDDIYFYDEAIDEYVLHSDKPLLVFLKNRRDYDPPFKDFPFKYSIIYLKHNTITFTKNGWIKQQNGLWLYGEWGFDGLSISLPDDYQITTNN